MFCILYQKSEKKKQQPERHIFNKIKIFQCFLQFPYFNAFTYNFNERKKIPSDGSGKTLERWFFFNKKARFLCGRRVKMSLKRSKKRRKGRFLPIYCPEILKVDSNNAVHLIWRRRRDLNPCYSFPYYSLSRGAP